MSNKKKGNILGKLQLLFVAVCWGSAATVVKGGTDVLPPGTLLACRFTIASVALAIASNKKLKQLDKEYLKSGVIIGICLFMAFFTQTLGTMLEMPGRSHFLSSAYCVFVPFIGWAVLRKKPNIYYIAAAFMCAVGIIVISVNGSFSISPGDSLSIVSSVFWASQIVAIAKWGKGKDPMLITMLQFIVCAACAWIFTLVAEDHNFVWTGKAVGAVFYLGLVCAALCFLFQTMAQKTENPTSVSIILSFENIFGVVFGVIFYGETLSIRSFIGFLLIFVAIIVSETQLSFLRKPKAVMEM